MVRAIIVVESDQDMRRIVIHAAAKAAKVRRYISSQFERAKEAVPVK
jgi:hypothetical protein